MQRQVAAGASGRTGGQADSYSRPRHFEFRLLQIGNYQFVSSGSDPNERLSRLKVIFTTQKFVYEYELPPRIPYAGEGQVLITRMISVEVRHHASTPMK